jgi:hypothetical protein
VPWSRPTETTSGKPKTRIILPKYCVFFFIPPLNSIESPAPSLKIFHSSSKYVFEFYNTKWGGWVQGIEYEPMYGLTVRKIDFDRIGSAKN